MTLQVVGSLLGTLISSYIPGNDFAIKSLCAQAISQTISESSKLSKLTLWNKFSSHDNEVFIRKNNPIYEKMEEYIVNKFSTQFKSCGLITKRGNISYELFGRADSKYPTFWIENFKGNTLYIEPYKEAAIGQKDADTNPANTEGLRIYSKTARVDILKDYVTCTCEYKTMKVNTIKIFRSKVTVLGKRKKGETMQQHASWEELNVKTNKNISNTIVSEQVEKDLYEDISWFLSNESWYNAKGLPYKRGYILSGPPGTGKTSAVKAVANEHNLDIFLVDLETIETNNALYELLSEAAYLANNKPHILSLEDVDRCKLFKKNKYDFNDTSNLSIPTFLGLIDGIVEPSGRILFLTVNDLAPLQAIDQNALLRPGRIDKIVNFQYCDKIQCQRIIKHFYDLSDEETQSLGLPNSFPNNLSPADVIKLLQTYPEPLQIDELLSKLDDPGLCETIQKLNQDASGKTPVCKITRIKRKSPLESARIEVRVLNQKKKSSEKFLKDCDEKLAKAKSKVDTQKQKQKQKKEKEKTKKKQGTKSKKSSDTKGTSREKLAQKQTLDNKVHINWNSGKN